MTYYDAAGTEKSLDYNAVSQMLPEQLKSFLMGEVLFTRSRIQGVFGRIESVIGANENSPEVIAARRALVKSWESKSCGQSERMIERLVKAKKSTPTGVNLATAASEMMSVIKYNALFDQKIEILRGFRNKLNTEFVCNPGRG
jgi:hypothetical protein